MADLNQVDWSGAIIRGCIWDPQLGAPGSHPNGRFFGEIERYLSGRQIAHAADAFNTYCQNILAEILEADQALWPAVSKSKNLRKKNDREAAVALLKVQQQPDVAVRDALKALGIGWCNEIEIISVLRNKIVHQAGFDPEGEVEATAKDFPPGEYFLPPQTFIDSKFPVARSPDGWLIVDAVTAHWATRYVLHFIHLTDQHICHRFGVPRARAPMHSTGFTMGEGFSGKMLIPGTPLPVPPPLPPPSPAPEYPEFPDYEPMATPEEIECARLWRGAYEELQSFIRETSESTGIDIRAYDPNLAGRPASHAIACHDMHIGALLASPDPLSKKSNRLGVRLRQNNFKPFVTVWSEKTMMRDFQDLSDLTKVKDEIASAIHATLQ